jgi:hypothetical protein
MSKRLPLFASLSDKLFHLLRPLCIGAWNNTWVMTIPATLLFPSLLKQVSRSLNPLLRCSNAQTRCTEYVMCLCAHTFVILENAFVVLLLQP